MGAGNYICYEFPLLSSLLFLGLGGWNLVPMGLRAPGNHRDLAMVLNSISILFVLICNLPDPQIFGVSAGSP